MSSLEPFNTGKMIAGGSLGGIVITLILGACYFLFGWLFNDSSDEEASTTTYTIAGAIVLGLIGLGLVGLLAFGIYRYRKTSTGIIYKSSEQIRELAQKYLKMTDEELTDRFTKLKDGIATISGRVTTNITDLQNLVRYWIVLNKAGKDLTDNFQQFASLSFISGFKSLFIKDNEYYESRYQQIEKESTSLTDEVESKETEVTNLVEKIKTLNGTEDLAKQNVENATRALEDAKTELSSDKENETKKTEVARKQRDLDKATNILESVNSTEIEQNRNNLIINFTVIIENIIEKCKQLRNQEVKIKEKYIKNITENITNVFKFLNKLNTNVLNYINDNTIYRFKNILKDDYTFTSNIISNIKSNLNPVEVNNSKAISYIDNLINDINYRQNKFLKRYGEIVKTAINVQIIMPKIKTALDTDASTEINELKTRFGVDSSGVINQSKKIKVDQLKFYYTTMSKLKESLKELKETIKSVNSDNISDRDKNNVDDEAFEYESNPNQSRITQLKSDKLTKRSEISILDGEIKDLEIQIDTLNTTIATNVSEITNLAMDIKTLTAEMDVLRVQDEKSSQYVNDARRAFGDKKAKKNELSQKNPIDTVAFDQADQEANLSEIEYKAAIDEKAQNGKKLASKGLTLRDKQQTKNNLETENEKKKNEIEALNNILSTKRSEKSTKETEIRNKETEIIKLSKKLSLKIKGNSVPLKETVRNDKFSKINTQMNYYENFWGSFPVIPSGISDYEENNDIYELSTLERSIPTTSSS